MPIKFRCQHCRQFLGISRAKAGGIADCPMCGKAVRVPNLDGTVKPLPKPELNLEDSSLVSALGELAGIGSEDETIDSDLSLPNEPANSPAVQPAAEPISLQPLQPAKPVTASAVAAPTSAQSPSSREGQQAGDSPLPSDDLRVDLPDQRADDRPERRKRSQSAGAARPKPAWWRTWPVAVGCGAILLIGMASLLTMNDSPAPTPDADNTAAAAPEERPPPAEEPMDAGGPPAVSGRVTYISEAGDTRPDEGAKVIALPTDRGGTIKFDVAGFLVGSEEVDSQVATAALRALGGDVVTVDPQGQYVLRLRSAGEFQLLIISRHQSRRWETGVEPDVQKLLDRFFIRPSTLLGQLAYDVQDFSYRGQGTATRDVAFNRQ